MTSDERRADVGIVMPTVKHMRATEHLSKEFDYKFKLRFPLSSDYYLFLGLYFLYINLWNEHYDALPPEGEEELFLEIQEGLGITSRPCVTLRRPGGPRLTYTVVPHGQRRM
jgi:hypothetical protein